MLLIIGTIRLPPENLAAARPVMKRMVDASRTESGCVSYFYAEDIFEAGLIHVNELWKDQFSVDQHFASDHLKAWREAWAELDIHDRKLVIYDVGDPRQI